MFKFVFRGMIRKRRGRTRPIAFLLLILASFLLIGCGARTGEEITIIYTNDLHGHIVPARVEGWADRSGGYAVFVSWLKKVREQSEKNQIPTLLLDAGDIFMGTVEGNLTRGSAVIRLMNLAGYDALAVGNHEFDYGFFNLYQLATEADFPFLSANIFRQGSGEPLEFIRPYLIKDYNGLKVGIIGVTTVETAELTVGDNVEQVVFRDPAEAIRTSQRLLQEKGVDLLIVISHLGLEEDRRLAEAIGDIDLIIGGHSHDILDPPLRVGKRPTLIAQAGSYGRFAGRLDLRVDTEKNRIVSHRSSLFVNRRHAYPADIETNRFLAEVKADIGGDFDQTVGIAILDIPTYDENESPLGNLIADAMRRKVAAAAAFQNAYGIRANLFQGSITRRDIYNVFPFDNTIVTMNLSGRQIREILEQSLTLRKGLLQISGLRVEYDPNRPEGNRVKSARIGDEALDDATDYRIATNVFLAGGGDYFTSFAEGRDRRDSGVLLRDAVAEYISLNTPLHPGFEPAGRWVRE